MAKYELIKSQRITNSSVGDWILTVKHNPGSISNLLGASPGVHKYIGDCTVWYTFPDFRRCNTSMEFILSEFLTKAKYFEELK